MNIQYNNKKTDHLNEIQAFFYWHSTTMIDILFNEDS